METMTKRQIIFKNIVSAFFMSFLMSNIIILINFGFMPNFFSFWWPRWLIGFALSLITSFTIPPLLQKISFIKNRRIVLQRLIIGVTTSAIINFVIQLLSHGFVIDVFSFWLHKWPISLAIAVPISILILTPLIKFLIKVFKV